MRVKAPRRRFVTLGAVLALMAGGLVTMLPAGPAGAATVYIVTSSADTGPTPTNCTIPVANACTLRDAFGAANALNGDSEIDVNLPTGTVITTASALNYTGGSGGTHALAIVGNGVSVTLPANGNAIFASAGLSLSVDGMTITSGFTAVSSSIPVTVTNSHLITVVTTAATSSQGILGTGSITVTNSTIAVSQAGAGNGTAIAIFAAPANVLVTNSTITAAGASGQDSTGIQALSGGATVTLVGSTVTTTSTGAGAGFGITAAGTVDLTNSVVQVSGNGSGIASAASVILAGSTESGAGGNGITSTGIGGTVTIANSTVTGNASSGVVAVGNVVLVYATIVGNASALVTSNVSALTLTSFGSVIAKPGPASSNCFTGTVTTSNGYNFSDDANASTGCKFNAATDRLGTSNDPQLGALAANGGPTPTMLPASTSPLVNAIPLSHCTDDGAALITTDQRAFARPALTGCDIGAVEVQSIPIVARFTG